MTFTLSSVAPFPQVDLYVQIEHVFHLDKSGAAFSSLPGGESGRWGVWVL